VDVVATKESQAKMEAVDFQIDPSRYKHWRLAFDGPVATLTMDVAEGRWNPSGVQTEIDFVRPWRGHRIARCVYSAFDLNIRGSFGDHHQREEPHFLLRRQYLYARAVVARVESEFLQIHE